MWALNILLSWGDAVPIFVLFFKGSDLGVLRLDRVCKVIYVFPNQGPILRDHGTTLRLFFLGGEGGV